MDGIENLAMLVILLAWIVRSVLGALFKKRQPAVPEPEEDPQELERRRQATKDLLRELGLDLEPEEEGVPQEAEVVPPPPPPRPEVVSPLPPPSMQRRQAASPPPVPPPAARPARPEPPRPEPARSVPRPEPPRRPAPQPVPVAAPPEAPRPPVPSRPLRPLVVAPAARSAVGGSRLARGLKRDLRSGRTSVARAILLTEILTPPPGLLPPGLVLPAEDR